MILEVPVVYSWAGAVEVVRFMWFARLNQNIWLSLQHICPTQTIGRATLQ